MEQRLDIAHYHNVLSRVANGNMVPSTFNGNAVEKDVVAVVWRENS